MTLTRRDDQELGDRGALHRLGDGKTEVPAQVADRLALDVLGESLVARILQRNVVIIEELARGLGRRELQPVPVDDGATRQDQAQCLELVKRELVEPLQTRGGFGVQRTPQ